MFAPIMGILFESVVPYPSLLAVVAVTVGYGAFVVWQGTVVVGAVVALVITSTFALNVPLTSPYIPIFDEWYRQNVTGFVGPSLWAFQLPLAVLAAVGVKNSWYRRERYKKSELALGCVVIWAVISTVFGQPIHPVVAALFAVYLLQVWLAFVTVGRAIDDKYVTAGDTVHLVIVAVALHTIIAAAQFLNARSFGLSYLGGGAEPTTAVLLIPGGMELEMGLFVTGFTGMAYAYAALTVLIVPVVAGIALRTEDRTRKTGLFFLAAAMVFLNRATTSDAARGAMLISLVSFIVLLLFVNRQRVHEVANTVAEYVIFGVVGITITLAPSTLSNRNIPDEPTDSRTSTSNGTNISGGNTGNGSTPVIDLSTHIPDWILVNPFFSMNTFGIRLKQYVAAVNIVAHNLLFGIGGINFRYIALKYGIEPPMGIHNIYLMLAVGIGLPGLLFYLAALLSVIKYVLHNLSSERAETHIFAGTLAGMAGILAFGLFDHVVLDRFTVIIPFWLLAASILRMGEQDEGTFTRILSVIST